MKFDIVYTAASEPENIYLKNRVFHGPGNIEKMEIVIDLLINEVSRIFKGSFTLDIHRIIVQK